MSTTAEKTYAERVADLAKQIQKQADRITSLERTKSLWLLPESKSLDIGGVTYKVVDSSGIVNPALAGMQREAIAVHDRQILKAKSKLEGLRWQLIQLGKEGGAA